MSGDTAKVEVGKEITYHRGGNPVDDGITIKVAHAPEPRSHATNFYSWDFKASNGAGGQGGIIKFHDCNSAGKTNGLTMEVLIAICMHRLQCFQQGEFACQDNEDALEHLESELFNLNARTMSRKERGVLGQMVV